jgi:hypothetical protein
VARCLHARPGSRRGGPANGSQPFSSGNKSNVIGGWLPSLTFALGNNFGALRVFNPVVTHSNDMTGIWTRLGTLACLATGAFLIYMLSFAPAAGIAYRNRAPSMGDPRWLEVAYGPAAALWHRMPTPLARAYRDYIEWGIDTFSRRRNVPN